MKRGPIDASEERALVKRAKVDEDTSVGALDLLTGEMLNKILSYLSPQELGEFAQSSKGCRSAAADDFLWHQLFFSHGLTQYYALDPKISQKNNFQRGYEEKPFSRGAAELINLFPSQAAWRQIPILKPSALDQAALLKEMKGHRIMRAIMNGSPSILLCVKSNSNRHIFGNVQSYFQHVQSHGAVSVEVLARLQVMQAYVVYERVDENGEIRPQILIRFIDAFRMSGSTLNEGYLERLISGSACGDSPFPPHEGTRMLRDGHSIMELSDQSEFEEINQILLDPERSRRALANIPERDPCRLM